MLTCTKLTHSTLVFAQFAPEGSNPKAFSTLALQKVVYIICNLVTFALGLYKCSTMGLLPTGTADWLAFETRGRVRVVDSFPLLSVFLLTLGFGLGSGDCIDLDTGTLLPLRTVCVHNCIMFLPSFLGAAFNCQQAGTQVSFGVGGGDHDHPCSSLLVITSNSRHIGMAWAVKTPEASAPSNSIFSPMQYDSSLDQMKGLKPDS